jgi:putative colanic acid biosysnthesis UDP-glucose lipid carrier transferase
MNQQFYRFLRLCFIVLDLFMINTTYAIVMVLNEDRISDSIKVKYIYLLVTINITWILLSSLFQLYKQISIGSFETFSRATRKVFIYFLAVIILFIFLTKSDLSRLFILTFLIATPLVLFLNRLIYLFIIQYFRTRDFLVRKVLILGYNDTSKILARQLEEDQINTEIIGFCEEQASVKELTNYPIVGTLQNAIEVSRSFDVTEIYSTITPEQNKQIYDLIQQAELACIRFRIVPDMKFFARFPVHIDFLGDMPVFSVRQEPLEDINNRMRKRLFDIVFSSLVLIFILSWLIPLISLAIWIESGRPIFFFQERTGKDNRSFFCLKFRSMYVNRDSNTRQATKEDERITRIGRLLRKTNLDEFPQFLNVLRGDMSIVGPRPHMLKHTDDYSKRINQYMVRQFMKPGITGWAQVNGFRGETKTLEDMEKRVEHDLWYMEHWSLWLDARIIFLTAYNMFRGEKNAY